MRLQEPLHECSSTVDRLIGATALAIATPPRTTTEAAGEDAGTGAGAPVHDCSPSPNSATPLQPSGWRGAGGEVVLALLLLATPAHAASILDRPDFWYGIYQKGQKLGYGHSYVEQVTWRDQPAVMIADENAFQMSMLGQTFDFNLVDRQYTDPTTLEFLGYEFSQTTAVPGLDQHSRGYREGANFVIETLVGGKVSGSRIQPWDPNVQSQLALEEAARERIDPAVGGTISGTVFHALEGGPMQVTLTYGPAREIYLEGVLTAVRDATATLDDLGMTVTGLETVDGRILRTELLGGLMEIRMEDEALATSGLVAPDLLESSRVAVSGMPIPPTPVAALVVVPELDSPWETLFLQTPNQALEGAGPEASLRIRMVGHDAPAETLTDADRAAALGGDLYVQPKDPLIQERAAKIVAGIDPADAEARAFAIVQWVYETLEKAISPTTPNASEVIQTLRGDCGEHAVLTAALARAAGIPARVRYGLVWAPIGDEPGFYYHAWNTFWIDDHWLPVDSALGQFPADATHLAVAEGDNPANSLAIVHLYGRLSLHILEAVPGEFDPKYEIATP